MAEIGRRKKIRFDPSRHSTWPWTRSKEFGYRFDILLDDGLETEMVVCNIEGCKKIFNRAGTASLSYHLSSHINGSPASDAKMEQSLLKFAVCSTQSLKIAEDKSFLAFLEEFRKIIIDNFTKEIEKQARDLLPSKKTLAKWVDLLVDSIELQVKSKISCLKQYGGCLTIDFAKKQVDYIAVTAHFLDSDWNKNDFVLLFSPLPYDMKKTSANVHALVNDQMNLFGIHGADWEKIFVTTDEGSNVNSLGGQNHQPCLAHVGATLAKRTTRLYQDSMLQDDIKNVCERVEYQLREMEKLVGKLRKVQKIVLTAGKALKPPVETRWLSYFNMVDALVKNLDILQEAVDQFSPSYAAQLRGIANQRCFSEYLSVLEPVASMVIDVQSESECTSNRMLEHLASIWLHFQKKSRYMMGIRFMEFLWLQQLWNASTRKLETGQVQAGCILLMGSSIRSLSCARHFWTRLCTAVCEASAPKYLVFNYDEIRNLVVSEAAHLTPEETLEVTPTKRKSAFACVQPRTVENEVNAYSSLPLTEDDPLVFWKNHYKNFPFLAPFARLLLAVQASSSPSERAFKELRCLLVDFTRNRMSPERIAALVHLRNQFMKEFV